MLSIFMAISAVFVNSGFNEALIRKKKCTNDDYSTVFYYNIIVSLVFYLILYFGSGLISNFFNEPLLELLVKVLGLLIVINALTIIQRVILVKRIDFKLLTKISVSASIFSGIVGVTMAYLDYGVWSLVIMSISRAGVEALLLWMFNQWNPKLIFSKESFKELFSFGGNLLLLAIIDSIYKNIYNVIIGRYYPVAQLGFYTRADSFKNLPSQVLVGTIRRVSYPVLSSIQDNKALLKMAYKRLIKSTSFISFVLLIGMAAVSKDMVVVLIGEKWLQSAEYLQLLCFVGIFYPLIALNSNMLKVAGRTDIILKIGIALKVLAVPVILTAIFIGIFEMIIVLFFHQLIAYYVYSYYAGRFINYNFLEQIKDILPAFFLALIMGGVIYVIGTSINISLILKLIMEVSIGVFIVFGISEITKFKPYIYFKEIVKEKIKNFNHN